MLLLDCQLHPAVHAQSMLRTSFSLWRYSPGCQRLLLAQFVPTVSAPLRALRTISYASLTPSPSFPRPWRGAGRRCSTAAAAALSTDTPVNDASTEVFSREGTSFASLGFDARLTSAIQAAGFERPTNVQALAARALLGGRTTVLTAETGSGKTLAYVAPLLQRLLEYQDQADQRQQQATPGSRVPPPPAALVLCPNAALCEQVLSTVRLLQKSAATAAAADSSSNEGGGGAAAALSRLHAAVVSSASPPPQGQPVDLGIATPASLLNLIYGGGAQFGLTWSPMGLCRRMALVVFDEADLLLGGGYERDTARLLQLLRGYDREVAGLGLAAALGMEYHGFAALPRHIRKAGVDGGIQDMHDAGLTSAMIKRHKELPLPPPGMTSAEPPPPPVLMPWERQYVFVAATMPEATKKSVGASLRAWYPDSEWLSSSGVHKPLAHIHHTFVDCDDGFDYSAAPEPSAAAPPGISGGGSNGGVGVSSSLTAALVRTLRADEDLVEGGPGRVLVFAQDVDAAQQVTQALRAGGFGGRGGGTQVVQYHRKLTVAERADALAAMRGEQGNVVMVATDAAARGLDIPDITHVVQAGFASNAVDFLHRVGRTGRAGRPGRVTSLYCADSRDLVGAIREAMEDGRPVEKAFSRKRSFRKKLKKYGTVEAAQRASEDGAAQHAAAAAEGRASGRGGRGGGGGGPRRGGGGSGGRGRR